LLASLRWVDNAIISPRRQKSRRAAGKNWPRTRAKTRDFMRGRGLSRSMMPVAPVTVTVTVTVDGDGGAGDRDRRRHG